MPVEFAAHLEELLAALGRDLGIGPLTAAPLSGSLRAVLDGDQLLVPVAYLDHWRRFGVVPTALIRDAAYQAKRRQLAGSGQSRGAIEADAMAYAERFLRAVADA